VTRPGQHTALRGPSGRAPGYHGGGLADTLDISLGKGLVIDASVRVSVFGIELPAIEARIVIAGVDTCIRYLEARLRPQKTAVPGPISQGPATGLIPPPPPMAVPPAPVDQP
jgi:hypothetical protein